MAARGLDIPDVDWIVQFDPPDDPKEYIHRVGRTARGEGGVGHALLILRPEEAGFLRYLKQSNVPLNEFEFSWNKVRNAKFSRLSYGKIHLLVHGFIQRGSVSRILRHTVAGYHHHQPGRRSTPFSRKLEYSSCLASLEVVVVVVPRNSVT